MEGHIDLQAHVIVEESGSVVADVATEELTVRGKMSGNTVASDRISLASEAILLGNLQAPRIVLEDGARFRGHIEMDVPLPTDI